MNSTSSERCWLVMPAAGSARRMGPATVPKQYLPLAGRSVIEWSLAPFLERADCHGIVVVIAEQDAHWRRLPPARDVRIEVACGGAERADSVRAGLEVLADRAAEHDWVLVHDAARPCLPPADLERLIRSLAHEPAGGLLAVPLVDTLKRADQAGRVLETLPRTALWRALTPQMFRFGILRRALHHAAQAGLVVTDEAQAVEALGLKPQLIAGDPDNIKITVADDLRRAQRILEAWDRQ